MISAARAASSAWLRPPRSSRSSTPRLQRRACSPAAMSGASDLIIKDARACQIAAAAKTVAVLGCKTEAQAGQPAYFVPQYLQSAGVRVIPVPTYYPAVTEILGLPVVRDLKQIREPVDILDVFRRPQDLPEHLDDILAMEPLPACVWLQSGISNPGFEQRLADAGITVVVSRCLKVDHQAGSSGGGGGGGGGRSAL